MDDFVVLNGRYRLDARQGSGGMAEVYRAFDQELARPVAIKLLRSDFSHEAGFRERFRQEARAAAGLSHPNIVTVFDFGLDRDLLYLVMEYVPGTDLKTILRLRGRLPPDEAISLMIQACGGIGHAHRAGLVHCDVKPQNMLVTPEMTLKVTDFGIARALSTISPDEQLEVVWGSPQYFAPEQAAGGPPSPASDVYSLGVVFFEILAGQLPFSAASAEELARMHRDLPPPSPRRFNPEIPPAIEQVVFKVLSKEPAGRYRTADQLGRVLVSITRSQTPVLPDGTASPVPEQPAARISAPEAGSSQAASVRSVNGAVVSTSAATVRSMPPTTPFSAPRPGPPVKLAQEEASPNPLSIDWLTWILALLALLAAGGLIPFWLWVYYMLNPPI